MINLTVKLIITPDCKLQIVDNTDYTTITNISDYGIIWFLTDKNNAIVNQGIHSITDINDPYLTNTAPIDLISDGTFNYYKLLVPKFEYFFNENIYLVQNKYFIYNDILYYSDKDLINFLESDVTEIVDYTVLWDDKDEQDFSNGFDKVFSICKLHNCLMNLLRKSIDEAVKDGCDFTCHENDVEKLRIDFLFETVVVLKYLISLNKFKDAQRILDTISYCNNICSEDMTTNYSCHCG